MNVFFCASRVESSEAEMQREGIENTCLECVRVLTDTEHCDVKWRGPSAARKRLRRKNKNTKTSAQAAPEGLGVLRLGHCLYTVEECHPFMSSIVCRAHQNTVASLWSDLLPNVHPRSRKDFQECGAICG